jgi:hypothetical protein
MRKLALLTSVVTGVLMAATVPVVARADSTNAVNVSAGQTSVYVDWRKRHRGHLAQDATARSVYSGNYAAVAQSGHYSNIYVDAYPGVHVTVSRAGGVHVNVFIGNYW